MQAYRDYFDFFFIIVSFADYFSLFPTMYGRTPKHDDKKKRHQNRHTEKIRPGGISVLTCYKAIGFENQDMGHIDRHGIPTNSFH